MRQTPAVSPTTLLCSRWARSFDVEAVDIRTKRTESGADFRDINPKGYVPALVLDDGETITENIAVLDWIAEQYPALRPNGALSRTRLLEMLTFISTEIHRAFKPLWHDGGEPEKQKARETVAALLQFTATQMRGNYLFGDELSVADCYLFVMLRWADRFGIAVPEALLRLRRRMEARPSVQAALEREEVGALSRRIQCAASPAVHADHGSGRTTNEHRGQGKSRAASFRTADPRHCDRSGLLQDLRTEGWSSSTRKCRRSFPGWGSQQSWREAPSSSFVNRGAKPS